MYASVTTVQVQPDKVEELIRGYTEVAQSIPQVQGLKSARLLTDRTSGKVLILGLWETEADARAFETNPTFQQALAGLRDYLVGAPTREYYEVSFEKEYSQ